MIVEVNVSRPSSIQPSNHLDIEGIDALIEALKTYKGGVISISHDERFIRATSNQVRIVGMYMI